MKILSCLIILFVLLIVSCSRNMELYRMDCMPVPPFRLKAQLNLTSVEYNSDTTLVCVEGEVLKPNSKEPIEEAAILTIRFDYSVDTTLTDRDGKFTLDIPNKYFYSLKFLHNNYGGVLIEMKDILIKMPGHKTLKIQNEEILKLKNDYENGQDIKP